MKMEDSEKLTALKKAYADIILNTAKEAAARIMVSERKAMLFHRELVSTKDESLRMLLRLKQMLDSKVGEAETTSFSQQKKIEELEAQLQEAEEIVRDLRAELREVQAELEKVMNTQMYPTVKQNKEGENGAQEKNLLDNRLNPYGSLYSVSHSQCESVTTYDTRNSYVNEKNESCKCCVSDDHVNKCYLHNPDFASIVIRRKEPELYRNGCTQRIQAFERSLFDGNMSLPQNIGGTQNEKLVRGDEDCKGLPATISGDIMREAEKLDDVMCEGEQPDELKVLRGDEEGKRTAVTTDTNVVCGAEKLDGTKMMNGDTDNVEMPVCKQKKKILKKRKSLRSRICGDRVMETHEASYISCIKNCPHVVDNKDESREDFSKVCKNEAQNDLSSPPFAKVPNDKTAMIKQSGPHDDSEKEKAFLKVCSDWNKINDKELLDKSDLAKQESLSTETLEVPARRADVEATDDPSYKLGQQVSDTDEKVSCQSVNDKFLKYTFRRKRKKDSLSSLDVDNSIENCILNKKCGEKQNIHTEPQKSCTITESSRDSRRLAQVARQLISLSEKKWWQ